MKRLLTLTLTMGMLFGAAVLQASAEDKTKDGWTIKGQAVAGAEGVGETVKSSKFFEYRDVPNSFIFKVFELSLEKGSRYVNLSATRIRQRDARYGASFGDYGKFKIDFVWDKTPHRFSSSARTLYVNAPPPAAAPGVYSGSIYYYSLSDLIQTNLEAQPTYVGAKTLLSNYLTGAHDIDLGLQRNKGALNFAFTPSVPLSFTVSASRETRKGNRAIGSSFGLNNAVETPEPIDYVTTDVNAKIEYAKDRGTIQVGYDISLFDNNFQAMIWDNPYRITDRTYSGAYSSGDATSRGQMALWPSNNAQRFFASGAYKVFKHTKITGAFSYGIFNQNERLLPYTINTALANPIPDNPFNALQAPRATSKAKANITSFDLSLNSRLARSVYFNAGFRYYDFGNKMEALETPGFAVADQVFTIEAETIEPYSFKRTKAFADLSWNLMRGTSLKVGYAYSTMDRLVGPKVQGSEDNKSHENSFKLSFDSAPLDWLLVRVSYLNARRKWSLDGTEVIYSPVFNFKRYYEANRNRDAVTLLLGLSPIKNIDLQLSYMLGNDRYPTSSYGLKADDFRTASADLSYALSTNISLYGFYTRELHKGDQASRQSGAIVSTDTRDDWTAVLKDTVDTLGAGSNIVLVKDKLNLDLSYSFSRVNGTSKFFSPPGGTLGDAVNFTNGLDTTKIQTARCQFHWKFRPNFSIAFSYWYEQYDLNDITRNDYKADLVVLGNGMYLGALEPGYVYHVGSIKFIYSW
jgi:MtrB/PioB family decaheme-associated outer membrane protein